LIGSLDQLPAGRVYRARNGPCFEFLGSTDVAQVGRAIHLLEPGLDLTRTCGPDTEAFCQLACRSLEGGQGSLVHAVRILACCAVLELEIEQVPALRAILERVDRIGNSEVD
jgi:hypothetical protein